jgi:hypothetical protein
METTRIHNRSQLQCVALSISREKRNMARTGPWRELVARQYCLLYSAYISRFRYAEYDQSKNKLHLQTAKYIPLADPEKIRL